MMENTADHLHKEGGVNSEMTEEKEAEITVKTHNDLKGLEVVGGAQMLTNGSADGAGEELSSINAMMSAVMSAGNINGGDEEAGSSITSANSSAGPSPSPSPNKSIIAAMRAPPSRNARKNQETKEESSPLICPLCDKGCQSQHQLTMHIRQHNTDTGNTDHSCSICGKCLSSASSLDRHMLVHSGERPYRCSVCAQTFTTNGNMHRHMKIHEKDPASGLLPVSPPSPNKRRRPSVKRRLNEEENVEEPPSKKVVEESGVEEPVVHGVEAELPPCPICFKTCGSRLELDAHMDSHPDMALRCDFCCLSFRTHRGLLRHNASVHKLLPQDPKGRPFIQSNPSIPTGFNDLAFIDFSCKKFAHIAQVWCETNLRRCISKFHRFVCDGCDKAFPLRSALELHKDLEHGENPPQKEEKRGGATVNGVEKASPPEKSNFLGALGLQHVSTVKSGPTDDEIHQAHLDSIKVIHVEPPSSSLPLEPAAAALPSALLALGGLPGLSLSLVDGLSQRDGLSLLSLQPFQSGFLLHPDGGAATGSGASSGAKPGEAGGAGIMELADIQQILKVAATATNQMGLPSLGKTPGFSGGQGQKSMPTLKPKPPISPRSSLTATTPPPLQSSQQASLGCISPGLPPFKTPSSSMEMDGECDAHTPLSDSPPGATTPMHEEAGHGARKPGAKVGSGNGSAARGSFPCRFCDQVFAYSGGLQTHMRFHLGILPHQCNICDYIAPDRATLIRHLRTHSGERPYVCRVCHYPFTVKANCERHLRKKHAKTSRKDIEKNIKYVTSTAGLADGITACTPETEAGSETTCRFCGQDLSTYRALQIHLRTHNGCQRKPFECRRCGAAFLAKRNCIHHLLKQHPEVQEREIEEHIATLIPSTTPRPTPRNGPSPPLTVKAEEAAAAAFPGELEQPLDFSAKGRGVAKEVPVVSPAGVKVESVSPDFDVPALDQPIDLSIPSKRQRREVDVKAENVGSERSERSEHTMTPPKEEKVAPSLLGCYQLPPGSAPLTSARLRILKPLLPKPATTTVAATVKELPPLASIAQIIHSVSAAPDLLKRDVVAPLDVKPSPGNAINAEAPGLPTATKLEEDTTDAISRRRSRKKPVVAAAVALMLKDKTVGGVDLESSGEFASVEKMLATTDANKFSPFLQTPAELVKPDGVCEEKEGGAKEEEKPVPTLTAVAMSIPPSSKGKKNAYSNSVQKMICPFCPRVFPWASSLQRHMLTHTGQKPFPCPRCDSFFSTKSNCERHLLRKHGVTHRTLRRNTTPTKKDGEEGSHDSAGSQSETEQFIPETQAPPTDSGSTPLADCASPCDNTELSSDFCPRLEEVEHQVDSESCDHEEEPESNAEQDHQPAESSKGESGGDDDDDDDCHSNKSLDLNFGRKLIDFKLSEQPSPSSSSSSSAPSSVAPPPVMEKEEEPEKPIASPPPSPSVKSPPEYKHVCDVCKKSFRYATTLARHQRAHLPEEAPPPELGTEEEPLLTEEELTDQEEGGAKGGEGESAEEEEEEDEEGPKSTEGGGGASGGEGGGGASGGRVDKRKKICNVCGKRFWSLQDLTRHTRSHTGERPYQCQTCERTFTLKHSLVRHQRIHLKPRSGDGSSAANDDISEDGDSNTPTSTCPPSENESECGSAAAHAKDLDEVEEDGDGQREDALKSVEDLNPITSSEEKLPEDEHEATDSKTPPEVALKSTSDLSKDASHSLSQDSASIAPVVQGLLEIHAKPPLEHILPNGDTPLVAAD